MICLHLLLLVSSEANALPLQTQQQQVQAYHKRARGGSKKREALQLAECATCAGLTAHGLLLLQAETARRREVEQQLKVARMQLVGDSGGWWAATVVTAAVVTAAVKLNSKDCRSCVFVLGWDGEGSNA